ncbi:hypothetical protein SO802_011224 [Lithocarpus litseifolius]|uniref:Uncharacterized protein n=1 Tax=Lithocarpus litseifolius TaxID=425828 RepID=A0AAW2CZC8_9ROSI
MCKTCASFVYISKRLCGEAPAPKPVQTNVEAAPSEAPAVNNSPAPKPAAASPPVDVTKQIPAGIHSTSNKLHASRWSEHWEFHHA